MSTPQEIAEALAKHEAKYHNDSWGHVASDVAQIAAGGVAAGGTIAGINAAGNALKKRKKQQMAALLRRVHEFNGSGLGAFAKGATVIAAGDLAGEGLLDEAKKLKRKKARALVSGGIEQKTDTAGGGQTSLAAAYHALRFDQYSNAESQNKRRRNLRIGKTAGAILGAGLGYTLGKGTGKISRAIGAGVGGLGGSAWGALAAHRLSPPKRNGFDYKPRTTDLAPKKDKRGWLARNKYKVAGTAVGLAGSLAFLRKATKNSLAKNFHQFAITHPDSRNRQLAGDDIHSALRHARKHVIMARRAGQVAQDVGDDLEGKKTGRRKKAYQKEWFKNAVGTAALTGTALVAGRYGVSLFRHHLGATHRNLRNFMSFVNSPDMPPIQSQKMPDPATLAAHGLKPNATRAEWLKAQLLRIRKVTQFASIGSEVASDVIEQLVKPSSQSKKKKINPTAKAVADEADPDPGLGNNMGLLEAYLKLRQFAAPPLRGLKPRITAPPRRANHARIQEGFRLAKQPGYQLPSTLTKEEKRAPRETLEDVLGRHALADYEKKRINPVAKRQADSVGPGNGVMMEAIQNLTQFYGTSAGVSAAWDTRGRNADRKTTWWTHSPSRNSVRVVRSASESGPRQRRGKKPYERAGFQRKALAAAGIAALGLGVLAFHGHIKLRNMRKGVAQSNNAPVVMYKGKILDKAEPGKLLVVKHSGGEYHVSKHEAPAVKPEPEPVPAPPLVKKTASKVSKHEAPAVKPEPVPAPPSVKKTTSKRKTGVKTTYSKRKTGVKTTYYPIG
jgi:hypothetical protein